MLIVAAITLAVAPTAVAGARTPHAEPAVATLSSASLSIGPAHVVSTSGKKLALAVFAASFGPAKFVTINLGTRGRFGEHHQWGFDLNAGQFTVGSTGKAHLAATFGPLGDVDLHAKPITSATVHSCDADNYVVKRTEGIKGTFHFDTKSGRHGWHKILGSAAKLHLSTHATMFETYGSCLVPDPDTCETSLGWNTGIVHDVELDGGTTIYKHKTVGYLRGERDQTLSKPAGASRSDIVERLTPVPKFTSADDNSVTMAVTTNGNGAFGSATLQNPGPPTTNEFDCVDAHGNHGQNNVTYYNDSVFTNGAKKLGVSADLYGSIHAPVGPHASISTVSPVF